MDATLTMERIDGQPVSRSADFALAAAGAMSEASPSAVVPLKPTAAMLAAGARAGHVTVETAWKIYQAMIRGEH